MWWHERLVIFRQHVAFVILWFWSVAELHHEHWYTTTVNKLQCTTADHIPHIWNHMRLSIHSSTCHLSFSYHICVELYGSQLRHKLGSVKNIIFWVVMLFSAVKVCQCFRGTCCFPLSGLRSKPSFLGLFFNFEDGGHMSYWNTREL